MKSGRFSFGTLRVYLVFSYLIVPAVCGAILSERILTRLIIGWTVALVTGVAGLFMSVEIESLDLPTGPTIVCLFGVTLLICAGLAWKKKRDQEQPSKA